MSASQPITQVQDLGSLDSNNSTSVVGDNFIVKTGILHASTSSGKNGGHIGICHTTTSNVGVSSIHVNKADDILLRFTHPASAKVIGLAKGPTTKVTIDGRSMKLNVGDFVTMTDASVSAYNTTVRHVEITSINEADRDHNYKLTAILAVNTNSLATFTGEAHIRKSVIPLMKPDSNNGCEAFISEVQLG